MTTLMADGRGRVSLGRKHSTYKMTELEGGVLLLEPAHVMTAAELAVLNAPSMIEEIKTSLANPDAARAVPRRSRRGA